MSALMMVAKLTNGVFNLLPIEQFRLTALNSTATCVQDVFMRLRHLKTVNRAT